jgi:hypothetical protein
VSKFPYLTRSGKRGMYAYRRGVPAKLRPIPGKCEIVMSFRSDDLQCALAGYLMVAADVDEDFDYARSELDRRE